MGRDDERGTGRKSEMISYQSYENIFMVQIGFPCRGKISSKLRATLFFTTDDAMTSRGKNFLFFSIRAPPSIGIRNIARINKYIQCTQPVNNGTN